MAKAQKTIKTYRYSWKGVDLKGAKVSGELQSQSAAIVKAQLKKKGILPRRVSKKQESLFSQSNKITAQDIAVFSRQMATMMHAGVPLMQAFDIIIEGTENTALRNLVTQLRQDVASGGTLADALRKQPAYFDDLFCSLIEAGEQAGTLETMLDRIAVYKEKSEALKSKIKKVIKYPIAVLVIAGCVTALLLIKVVPLFAEMFENFGSELPFFTQVVMNLSVWVQNYWLIIFLGTVATVVGHTEGKKRSKAYKDGVDAVSLKLPIIGNIMQTAIYARFARTLGTTFAAGVPLVDSLDSVKGAVGNAVYGRAVAQIRDEVTTGITLNSALRGVKLFPVMMIQMIAIGEEAGDLETMLNKLAEIYEQQVDDAVDGLTSMIEPVIMAIMGVLVGGLMVAMYMPIFMMGSVL